MILVTNRQTLLDVKLLSQLKREAWEQAIKQIFGSKTSLGPFSNPKSSYVVYHISRTIHFSIGKATLQSQMCVHQSVHPSICHQNSSAIQIKFPTSPPPSKVFRVYRFIRVSKVFRVSTATIAAPSLSHLQIFDLVNQRNAPLDAVASDKFSIKTKITEQEMPRIYILTFQTLLSLD